MSGYRTPVSDVAWYKVELKRLRAEIAEVNRRAMRPEVRGQFAAEALTANGGMAARAIVFPEGLFTTPPTVTITPTNGQLNPFVTNLSAAGCTIRVQNWTTASAASAIIYWRAEA